MKNVFLVISMWASQGLGGATVHGEFIHKEDAEECLSGIDVKYVEAEIQEVELR